MTIGLTYTGDETKHQNYINWLKGDDDLTVVELSIRNNNFQAIEDCDGLVLSGGVDINPALAGTGTDYLNKPVKWNNERDEFEKYLYQFAQANNLPVLGICRGLQLVNVLQGGTLVADLADSNDTHKNDGEDKDHTVLIKDGTLLNEITNTAFGEVNSAHHQSIDKLGSDLQINSLAADGTIEGIEWTDKTGKPFLLCVQWHPERMFQFPNSPLSENIRNRFIQEITQSISSKK
jgi:putative glutamine amidotransferase